ncbi:MAG: hypothetical protein JEY96_07675 [Bacteroidales bacterium]|nr:hypothetical protein [Bacteroidales bacterium]
MKNYLKIGMALLIAVTMFSCDKDDDVKKDDPKENPVEFNDQTFSWNDYAELWYYSDDQFYNMNVFTGSLKVDYGRLTGSGDWLEIDFYTSTPRTLVAGDYVLSNSEEEGTCELDLDLDVNANGQYPTTGSSPSFTSGKVTIKGSGDTYTVTLDVTDEDGNKLEGTFKSSFATVNTN